ncbi:HAD-IA family hydrolase [Helicobacter cetorum]|uniref:HAD-IA family hydrolase n=1 Tax=Helicobacter cetorum TaxID=138563 RepID=UPI000CF15ED4|nr:HAD-IA family hydrolase [Helicobacter cetorum]
MQDFLKTAKQKILKYDVISFDIFDTLLLRPFAEPIDLFLYIEMEHRISGFAQKRVLAENRAREISLEQDITLDEIYACMPSSFKIYQEIEVATEKRLLVANVEMLELYNFAKENHKKVIITSDMYLPLDTLKNILDSKGFGGYCGFYVSNDVRLTKHSKDLFKHVLEQERISANQMLHIGDNAHADSLMAKDLGIQALLREKVLEQFKDRFISLRAFKPTSLPQSFILGTLSIFYKNYIPYQKDWGYWHSLGAIQAGCTIIAYCQFIYKTLRTKKVDTLVFIARDGYLIQKIFNLLYPNEYQSVYIYAPRILRKAVFLDITEEESLEILSILEDSKTIKQYQITNNQEAYAYLVSHVERCYNRAKKVLLEYRDYLLKQNLGDNIIIVDTITNEYSSQKLIEKALSREVFGIYFTLYRISSHQHTSFLPFKDSKEVLFDNWEYMEFLMTSEEPPILTLKDNLPIYQNNVSPYEKTRSEIYASVIEGALAYASYFKESLIPIDVYSIVEWTNFFINHPSPEDREHFKEIKICRDSAHKNFVGLFHKRIALSVFLKIEPYKAYQFLKSAHRTNKQEILFKLLSLSRTIYKKFKRTSQ